MLKNNFKVAFRLVGRHKSFSMISIIGLAVGIGVFIITFLYLQYNLSYDKFHENLKRIYRVEALYKNDRAFGIYPLTPALLAPALASDFPEIVDYVRIVPLGKQLLLTSDLQKKSFNNDGKYADNSIFTIFTFPLVRGNPQTALVEPYSMVISEETAEVFFPGENPLGKIIRIKDKFDCKVTGVVRKPPNNSHLQFSYLVSISTFAQAIGPTVFENWNDDFTYSYILTREEGSGGKLAGKIRNFLNSRRTEARPNLVDLSLKPLAKIHLHSNTNYELEASTPVEIVFLLVVIGMLVLLLACLNYANLSAAYAFRRAKEVWVGKVLGASRLAMIKQFLAESLLVVFLAFIIALFFVLMLFPEFNSLLHCRIKTSFFFNWQMLGTTVLLVSLIGILSGLYPALLLSSFRGSSVLRGTFKSGSRKTFLRKALLTCQFIFCTIFAIGAIVVYQEGRYIRNIDKGFQEERLYVQRFDNVSAEALKQIKLLKNELKSNQQILNASLSTDLPHAIYSDLQVNWEGGGEQTIWTTVAFIDHDFFRTYGIGFKEGRAFAEDSLSDQQNTCIINETMWRRLNGNSSALGKRIDNNKYTIIGMVKDFNSSDMRLGLKPLLLLPYQTSKGVFLSIKIAAGSAEKALRFIKTKFKELLPDDLLELRTFQDYIDVTFVSFNDFVKTLLYLSILSLIIATLGLYALAALSTRQRTKEIGIRKVVGASVLRIVMVLLKEFFVIIGIAFVFAWPLSYFIWNTMLSNFAYRIVIGAWVFVGSGLIIFAVALLSILYQTAKAASANPVESLRYE